MHTALNILFILRFRVNVLGNMIQGPWGKICSVKIAVFFKIYPAVYAQYLHFYAEEPYHQIHGSEAVAEVKCLAAQPSLAVGNIFPYTFDLEEKMSARILPLQRSKYAGADAAVAPAAVYGEIIYQYQFAALYSGGEADKAAADGAVPYISAPAAVYVHYGAEGFPLVCGKGTAV